MWKTVCVLSVLILLLDSGSTTHRVQRQLFKKGGRWIPQIPSHSSFVPFWQHSKLGNFTCDHVGYFPFPQTCQYFVKCVAFVAGHLFRFVYKCEDERVYSIKDEACVLPADSGRVECDGKAGPGKKTTNGPGGDSPDKDDILSQIEEDLLHNNGDTTCVEEGFFGVQSNCSQFYRCVSFGYTYVQYNFSCPPGTIWDDEVKTCNFRTAVHQITCKEQPVKTANELTTIEPEIACPIHNLRDDQSIFVCPHGLQRHTKYCNIVYQCWLQNINVHIVLFTCPNNSTFDNEKLQCVENGPIDSDCTVLDTTHHKYLLNIKTTKPICPDEGLYPYSETPCDKNFFSCIRDAEGKLEATVKECTDGIYVDAEKKCQALSDFPQCQNN